MQENYVQGKKMLIRDILSIILPGRVSVLTTCQCTTIINVSPNQAAHTHQTDADPYNVHNLVAHPE